MFGIGFQEFLIIGVVLLLAVGPNKLPQLFKSLVTGYREIRKATRDLRASTGIDEIMRDEDLKDLQKLRRELRKPIHIPEPTHKPQPALPQEESATEEDAEPIEPALIGGLTIEEREREQPTEGVDIAEARYQLERPDEETAEMIRAAKLATAQGELDAQRIIDAKLAAAEEEARRGTASFEEGQLEEGG